MIRKILFTTGLFIMVAAFLASDGYGDWRSYVWTYEYMTMKKGKAELEYYLTMKMPDTGKTNVNTWQHQFELEYGITDRWDVSMYQNFKQINRPGKHTFNYDGFKIRTRYRIWEKGKLPLDTLLYFEYIRPWDFSKPNIIEGKLIFAKDIGKLNLAYNQIIKQGLDRDSRVVHEYAAGASYEVAPGFKLGAETKGNFTAGTYFVGPTISWAPTNKFWASLGVIFGTTKKSDDIRARIIVGFPF